MTIDLNLLQTWVCLRVGDRVRVYGLARAARRLSRRSSMIRRSLSILSRVAWFSTDSGTALDEADVVVVDKGVVVSRSPAQYIVY